MMRYLLIALLGTGAVLAADPAGDAVPLVFIENHGQAPSAVRFMVKGSGLTAFFSAKEARFHLQKSSVRLQFPDASPAVRIEGLGRLPGEANFLIGPEEEWRLGVPLYGGVVYRGLYPGIDMVYGNSRRDLKSEFVVAPGADASAIRVRYLGSEDVRLGEDGALVIPVNGHELREQAPEIYQVRGSRRVPVEGRFAVAGGVVSFIVNDYDRSLPLVIDPVLSYSTLLGGSNSDAATALAVDSTGAVYVAGFTASYDFPTANPEQNSDAGSNDAFVAKLNSTGTGLTYCTYVGGKADDRAFGIAVDAGGSAYVTGSTTSSNFPMRNAFQGKIGGSKNAFVLKLNPAGNTLVYSSYLGGNASDIGYGIAVDASGNAYLVGDASSPNFPAGAFQKNNSGGQDAFVAKVSPDGSRLVYSTFLGGGYDDHGAAIAVDAGGSVYVTGSTYSSNFPLSHAAQGAIGGGQDAFVARFSADGSSLLFSTFLGGSGGALGYPEAGQGIALDAQGNVYVAGTTSSANFPVLNPLQSSLSGASDAFVAKLSSSGVLTYSTFLGGSGMDAANAIAIDAGGNAYVVGQTFSADLPVTVAFQTTYGGNYDAFAAKVSPADSLVFLSYLGGSGADTATAVALDPAANIYIAGWTLSTDFPVLNGYQSTNAGNYGAFVSKIATTGTGAPPAAVSVTPNSGSGLSQTFSLQFSDSAGASDLTTVSALFNSSTATANACSVVYTQAANSLMLLTDTGASGATITPGSGSLQNSQCVLNGAGSSVSKSGNVLTLNLSITFQTAFSGARNVYLQATNPYGSSGWQLEGSWTVPAGGPPAPVSVTPASGSGSIQTFSFVYTDAKGYTALSSVRVLINTALSGTAACYFVYYVGSNQLYLENDASSAWAGSVTLGQSGTAQNSQCIVNGAASSALGSGSNLTLNVALAFPSGFTGSMNVYMGAYDGMDSGWQQEGVWTLGSVVMGPVSVTPNSGSATSQTFGFVYADPKGYTTLSSVRVLINGTLSGTSACYFVYYAGSNQLFLENDDSSAWAGSVTVGQSGTVQNSQCIVNSAASSVSGSGSNLTLNIGLTFQPAFAGAMNIYMDAYDGSDAGWQQKGTWTLGSVVAMGPVSVTPNSGSASSQTFSFVYADPKGYTALSSVRVLINSALSGTSACYFVYYAGSNQLFLENDASSAWAGSVTIGQSGTTQNSQCIVNGAASSVSGSGSNLTLNVALTFQAAFAGAMSVYMDAYDGTDPGWQQKGTWTLGNVVMGPVSVTPNSGSGSSQTFSFVYADPKGYTALASVRVLVNSALSGTSACYFVYYPGSNQIYLENDGSTAWAGSVTVGQSGTAQNSQCIVNGAASTASGSGSNLTLNVALAFQSAFAGAKNVYLDAYDGTDAGWQQKGVWTVH